MNTHHHPLRDGNRLQRAYYRWAVPYYERMTPELREQAETIDMHLYSRRGLGFWLGLLGGLAGATAGLHLGGMPLLGARLLSFIILAAVGVALLSTLLQPESFLKKMASPKRLAVMLVLGLSGGIFGFFIGRVLRAGRFDGPDLIHALQTKFTSFAPGLLVGLLIGGLILWTLARARSAVLHQQRDKALLMAERDAAARSAAEADFRLLQAQIHPHFVFNTLATLQHWVNKKDDRAGPLLRELTGFLRGSTEMLGRSSVPLGEELQAVRHYLTILQTRLGSRLQWQIEADPLLSARELPPGLLLTLVENAIEHGLEPKIGGGQLWVRAESLPEGWRLAVLDDGQGIAVGASDNVGLSNLRQRLHHHFGATARFTLSPRAEGGTQAEMTLP
jgi:hypothetical protein